MGQYGVFVFQCLDYYWVGDYEFDQCVEEWMFVVYGVEVFGFVV